MVSTLTPAGTMPNPYVKGSNYAQNSDQLVQKHGAGALDRARKLIKTYASESEKRLFSTRLGNDYETIDRILSFGKVADQRYREVGASADSAAGILYGETAINSTLRAVHQELTDKFRNAVNIDIRQSFIERHGDPENPEP